MSTDESHRIKARRAIIAARKGNLPKPKVISEQAVSTSSGNNVFETARENSIEVYDDKFARNSILTRSARMRKFKFYQYKPIQEASGGSPRVSTTNNSTAAAATIATNNYHTNQSPQSPGAAILLPRDDILQGKVTEQSQESVDLDNEISALERKIANLNSDVNNLNEMFELVNKKNDLLRRQMQLNIIEQEKVLEKANEELTKELRSLMSIEDCKKSKAQLERQQYLYDQSLALVNKRNELVLHMDVQEKAIDDDNEMKARLKTVFSDTSTRNKFNGQDQNCCIQ